ncbi:hypothetical protein MMB17_01070 [Methylobacterium organophilum]|uniref:hypothetical protein n=1 Tax=Methylobacterium organophilum TaxID=410 RepID=UPI001F12E6D6|nr:hypothetical protein [Methylobacterium organophilum]UMY17982.1 hypothetical protein MMB17_01070 [Methylobacterium organophilum]
MEATTKAEQAARRLAELTYSAYAQQATALFHPQQEQTLLARLAEAAQPRIGRDGGEIVAALNAALEAWEQADGQICGPRIAQVDPAGGQVRLETAH